MPEALIDAIRSQLEKRISMKALALPMLPQVTTQVLSLVNDVNSDAAALAKLIQSDQALAGHVMRIANSAAYSPNAKMTSLQQAIARLGMQNMSDIAMAATMGPKIFDAKGFESLVKQIWEDSLATAVWAREIARQGRRNVESTFLCGLLCQIGRPVVLQTVIDIANQDELTIDEALVTQFMQQYQSEVGQQLAKHWQLPVAVGHTIEGINSTVAPSHSADVVATVKAAQVFAAVTLGDRNYQADSLSADPTIIEMNLYADDVQQLLEKAESIHNTIAELSL
ncbi:HDOD domain-containing protein [Oceanicoccus sp. KOV_DT_Chl]|uniref:HDOD domain-containing protein n=1 Tax=Oceanicoccus sp. KOV_DT_Chl TaxID=1904639 RepID=UPI000C7BE950|nr:HDOD domain-containing protein [Oceanicoccus sp. KOV_DT_Chl]